MNYIAINHESSSFNKIHDFCDSTESLNLVGTFNSTIDAAKEIKKNNINVIFIDAMILNVSSLEFLKYLPNPPQVI